VSVDLPDVAKALAVLGRALPPLHFVGPANDPYRLAIVSGAALLSRWLPVAPDDRGLKENSAPPDSARKRPRSLRRAAASD
jgi:hypothetical protein